MKSSSISERIVRIFAVITMIPHVAYLPACTVNRPLVAPPSLPATQTETKPTYSWLNKNVFRSICIYCHGERKPNLHHYDSIQTVVVPGKPLESRLYFMVATNRMPKGGRLSDEKKWAIYQWILNGAKDD